MKFFRRFLTAMSKKYYTRSIPVADATTKNPSHNAAFAATKENLVPDRRGRLSEDRCRRDGGAPWSAGLWPAWFRASLRLAKSSLTKISIQENQQLTFSTAKQLEDEGDEKADDGSAEMRGKAYLRGA